MSLMMEARKVQKVGYSTLIVSLPKDWVEEVSLKQGDIVTFRRESDGGITVYPGLTKERENYRYVIDADLCDGTHCQVYRGLGSATEASRRAAQMRTAAPARIPRAGRDFVASSACGRPARHPKCTSSPSGTGRPRCSCACARPERARGPRTRIRAGALGTRRRTRRVSRRRGEASSATRRKVASTT